MRRTIHKIFGVWDFDKEERWLNEMAARGLSLVSVGYCSYTFEESEKGEYAVRLELLDEAPTHPKSERYIHFIEDTGAEYIGSLFRWVYFRKKKATGEFDLYSDYESRIRHLTRILVLIGAVTPVMFINIFNILIISSNHLPGWFQVSFGSFFSVFVLLSIYGFIRVWRMRRSLKREHSLYE